MSASGDDTAYTPETPFRVAALVRWSLAQSVPFAPRGYIDDARTDLDELCRTEWDFLTQALGRTLHTLVQSLPPDDTLRRLDEHDDLVPELAGDLLIPTTSDLDLDADFVPAARRPQHAAARLIRAAAVAHDSGELAALLAGMPGDDATGGFTRTPDPDLYARRRDAMLAAEDAYRWIMWRRTAYLLGDDPEGTRLVSVWVFLIHRALTDDTFDTSMIERSLADLAIDRPF